MRRFLKDLAAVLLFGTPLASGAAQPPIEPVPQVDLPRYMGDWYVIAAIPSYFERQAFRALESYSLTPEGQVKTTFSYRNGALDGKLETMHATGFVQPGSGNALWGMQFIWPVKAEYIIAWLAPDYHAVIVARNKRDYVWIMARTPVIAPQEYDQLVAKVADFGYDTRRLRKVPW